MGKRGKRWTWYGKTIIDRFWAKVAISKVERACWFWEGAVSGTGYGSFTKGVGESVSAHVFAYEIANGEIPQGKVVRHTCDMPLCVNPDHLILGTHKENSQDAVRAGAYKRKACLRGQKAAEAARLILSNASLSAIARQFNVSYAAIHQIKSGRSYRKEMQEALAELTQNKNASHPAKNELALP